MQGVISCPAVEQGKLDWLNKVADSVSFEMMAKKGILLVASAGNGGDRDLDLNNQRFPGLIVGSVSPLGVASRYSQGGAAVDLLAPADYFLEVNFGKNLNGTSLNNCFSMGAIVRVALCGDP